MACTYTLGMPEGRRVLVATLLASGMAFLMGSAVVVSLPAIQSHFQSSVSGIQWVVSAQLIALTSLLLLGGALGDRFGRRTVFVAGILVYSLGSGLSALSSGIWQLVAFQSLQGVGASLMIPQSLAIINGCFVEEQRGRVIGLWASMSGGIAAIGPWVGGWLVETATWRAVFVLPVPVGLVAVVTAVLFVPRIESATKGPIDWGGTVIMLLGLLAMSYALVVGPDSQWSGPGVVVAVIATPLLLLSFLVVERRSSSPLVDFSIFRSRLVAGANLVTLLLYFSLNGVILYLSLHLQQALGYEPARAGLSLLPPVVIITAFSGPAGALADKLGPRLQMIAGPFIVGIGVLTLSLAGPDAEYVRHVLPGLLLLGVGMALTIAPLTKSALSVDESLSGIASGVNNAVSRLAALLSVAVLGGVIVMSFSAELDDALRAIPLSQDQREGILAQSELLGALEIPMADDEPSREAAAMAVNTSLVKAFHDAMRVCAALCFLSAGVSWVLIRPRPGCPSPPDGLVGQCHPVPLVRVRSDD